MPASPNKSHPAAPLAPCSSCSCFPAAPSHSERPRVPSLDISCLQEFSWTSLPPRSPRPQRLPRGVNVGVEVPLRGLARAHAVARVVVGEDVAVDAGAQPDVEAAHLPQVHGVAVREEHRVPAAPGDGHGGFTGTRPRCRRAAQPHRRLGDRCARAGQTTLWPPPRDTPVQPQGQPEPRHHPGRGLAPSRYGQPKGCMILFEFFSLFLVKSCLPNGDFK